MSTRIQPQKILTGVGWTKHSLMTGRLVFYHYGHEFQRAAQKTGSLLVRSYLCGHALELFLKAYLLGFGMGVKDLKSRRFGHNIELLLDEAINKGFDKHFKISSELKSDISQFNSVYSAKALEYFSLLHLLTPPQLPEMARLSKFVALLDRKLPKVIALVEN